MRKINTGDVFKLARIIKATGAKEDIINIYSESKRIKEEIRESATQEKAKEKSEEAQEKIGINIFFAIFEKCSDEKVEKLVYKLIGGIAEKKETGIFFFSKLLITLNINPFLPIPGRPPTMQNSPLYHPFFKASRGKMPDSIR